MGAGSISPPYIRGDWTFLTRREPGPRLLRHEAVHAEQWARHGLTFPFRYGREELRHRGARNRFEVEAGLEDGGYRG